MTDDEFADYCRRGGVRHGQPALGGPGGATPGTCPAATTTRRPTPRLAEVLAECDQRLRDGRQPGLLLRHAAAAVRADRGEPRQGRSAACRPATAFVRAVIEKPFGWDEDERPGPLRRPVDGVRGGPDLPHRPLPGQGDGAEPAGAAVRQLDLRADLEPHLGGQRADHRRRDPRRRRARRVLRDDGGDARHRPEPRPAGAVAVPHGAAHLVPRRGDPRREGQAAAGHPAAGRGSGDRGQRRPRAVHPRRHPRGPDARVPGGAGRRPAELRPRPSWRCD